MKTINIYNQSDTVAVIDIDGTIGWDWWKGEPDKNTKERMKEELKKIAEIKAETIIVNINSYGGDVNHGLSIHDLLAESKANVITKINGMTASAATIIACAGNERKMSDNALGLIHKSLIWQVGNENDFEQSIQDMRTVNERIANIYAKTGGQDVQVYKDLMNENNGNGKWITADEMKEIGLVTEVFEPTQMSASFDFKAHKLPEPPQNLIKFNNQNSNKMYFKPLTDAIADLKNTVTEAFKNLGGKPKDDSAPDPSTENDAQTEINNKIQKIENDLNGAKTENEKLVNEASEKDTKINNLETKIEELQGKLDKANGKPTNVKDKADPDPINDASLTPEQKAERQAQEAYKEAMGN